MKLTGKDIKALQNYPFPGNVRELQNIIERAVIMNNSQRGNFFISELFDNAIVQKKAKPEDRNFDESVKTYDELKELERNNIIKALKTTNYRIYEAKGAAGLLKIKPTTLISKIKTMKIPVRP